MEDTNGHFLDWLMLYLLDRHYGHNISLLTEDMNMSRSSINRALGYVKRSARGLTRSMHEQLIECCIRQRISLDDAVQEYLAQRDTLQCFETAKASEMLLSDVYDAQIFVNTERVRQLAQRCLASLKATLRCNGPYSQEVGKRNCCAQQCPLIEFHALLCELLGSARKGKTEGKPK